MENLLNKKLGIAILLSLSMTLAVFSQTSKEATFKVSSNDLLDVSLRQGNIDITTGSGNEVKIIGKNLLESERDLLTMEQKSGKVEVKFKGEDSDNFTLVLQIPASMNLDMSTGGGNIDVKGDLNGKVDASTGGGNITAGNINGKTDFSTAGGNVSVGDVNGDADLSTAGGDMKAGSINGKADISTAGGNIKVESVNNSADISTAGGNIEVGNIGGAADVSTAGGNIKIGNVSGSADVLTAGGNISLDGANGEVETSTAAGNISLKNIKGSLEANTAAGNIYAELQPEGNKKSELNSAVGNITLKVPENSKVTIVATLSVLVWDDKKSDTDYIESDFKPTQVNKKGDQKQIEFIYKLNGGGPTIEVNVAMGDIEIRKLK